MFGKLMKLSMLPVLGATLVLAACENGAPTENLLGPEIGAPAFEVIETTLPDGYKVVQETDPTVGYVQGIIDENGGSLQIGSHTISVPAGAVPSATTFSLIKPEAGKLAFSLRAERGGQDVGAAGFDKPVKLVISFGVSEVENPGDLVIGWVKDGGEVEFQPTSVSSSKKTATAQLDHFSDYALVMP